MYGDIPDYRYRIMDYVGDGFLVGGSLGSAFHFIRGFKNSPSDGRRLAGGIRAVRTNLPRVAGSSGAGLAVFSAFESAMFLARGGREDHWNSIAAGAAAFGLAKARRGALAATLFALLGAATFAGLAGARWTVELWHSRLHRLDREVRMNRGLLPAPPLRIATPSCSVYGDPIIGSTE